MRLSTKIIFMITVALSGLGVISSLLVHDIMLDVLKKNLRAEGLTITRTLASGITMDVIGNETVLVREHLRAMVDQTPDLEYVFVVGFEDELFAHSFEGGFPPGLHVQKYNMESPFRFLDTEKGPVMEIRASLIKDLPAHVHIGLNESSLYVQANALRDKILLLTLSIVVITCVIAVMVSQRITRPLGRLVDSMRAFGRDETIERFEISGGGMEVEELTVTFKDMIKKLKQASKALQESEKKFRDIVESTPDWIWEMDKNGVYTYVSPNIKKLLGYEPEDIIGKTGFDLMPPDEAKRVGEIFADIAGSKKSIVSLENINIHRDGYPVVLETSGEPVLNEDGNLIGYRGVDRDITDRKRAEEQIKASLAEKEMLLKEIHHRVKNNMQVITSLLRLQADDVSDEHHRDMFKESCARIQSMAMIHEKLYQAQDLASIGFEAYVGDLARSLIRMYAAESGNVSVKVEISDVALGLDTAIPCGLLVNELILNSLKHGFPQDRKGEITVALRPLEDDQLELTVSDNGIGMPEGLDFRNTESLGLHLVTLLAEGQLGGTVEVDRTNGTSFRVVFRSLKLKTVV